jgi:hypothetical protein
LAFLHTPLPSQDTGAPAQVVDALESSWFKGMLAHVPFGVRLQAMQVAVQALSQQYPSTQKLLPHSVFTVQV